MPDGTNTQGPRDARGPATCAPALAPGASPLPVPAYLRDVYRWAYLNPLNARLLDREHVVSVILWGNHRRLARAARSEFGPGQWVLQAAHVYGDFIPALARRLGPAGKLDVVDVAPLQVGRCLAKLGAYPWTRVRCADASDPGGGPYDGVCCYFLLHELPDPCKRDVVDALLAAVKPGGKLVFVDYHRPPGWHPVGWIVSRVFDALEPFAKGLWGREIADFASRPEAFAWEKHTYFGGLYQKVVARRPGPAPGGPRR